MSKKDIAYAHGLLAGIRESGWTCGDCGNFYDAAVESCPNRLLDEARVALLREKTRHRVHKAAPSAAGPAGQFGYRAAERAPDDKVIVVGPFDTREEAENAGGGQPVVEMSAASAPDGDHVDAPTRTHLIGCPCEDGPCCPWMGECACQCLCDFIAQIEERVRAEYDPSENDADEGYRTGYATAVAEFMSNHGDDATFKLGYRKAMMDITEKACQEQGAVFATVDALMKDLTEGQS